MAANLLTTAAAARRLGVTPQHARLLCARDILAARRIGRDWLIESAVVDAYATAPARKHGRPGPRQRHS